jgi:hypothetical protein
VVKLFGKKCRNILTFKPEMDEKLRATSNCTRDVGKRIKKCSEIQSTNQVI